MRPRTLEEFVGQDHIVAPGRLLYRAIKADQLSSVIFHGPPGTGKTTLARVIANTTKAHFVTINAVLAGVKEIREAIDEAKQRLQYHGRRTILFVDEVHRWNKAQQDALLPWVENGTVIMIGATTENPFFEVNRALVSRSRVFQLRPLDAADLRRVAEQALLDVERGYGSYQVRIDNDALDHLVNVSDGDARSLLNALELAVETTPDHFPPPQGTVIHVNRAVAEESIQRRAVLYDKEGDYHFDTISAFIKSLRGSDPDAALYWLARMVYAGEHPQFLFRRMLIFASEDVGLADPHALVLTQAAAETFDRVGLPEGRYALAHATLYLATAPKSNSTMAFFDALRFVEENRSADVPTHLKDASRDREGFGHGEGYLYPHSYREHWVAQRYLPEALRGAAFYEPGDTGAEATIRAAVLRRREAQLEAFAEAAGAPGELLTFSPGAETERWIARAEGTLTKLQERLRSAVFEGLVLQRHSRALDLTRGSPFLTWELARRVPEGGVWTFSQFPPVPDAMRTPITLQVGPGPLAPALESLDIGEVRFDLIVGRAAMTSRSDRAPVLRALRLLMAPAATLALVEPYPRAGQRLSVLAGDALGRDLAELLERGERAVYEDPDDDLTGWTADSIREEFLEAGFVEVDVQEQTHRTRRRIASADLDRWLTASAPSSYLARLKRALPQEGARLEAALTALRAALAGRDGDWQHSYLILRARRG
jgi:putative ATPase